MKITLAFTAIFLFLTGCSCKQSYMPENFIVKPQDKNMNCREIIYAINETEFWIKNVNERCKQPHVFSKFLPCTPMVKLDAMRNNYTLSDRAHYLRSLYKLKGCESSLKLRGTSIERQSGIIGCERNKMRLEREMLLDRDSPIEITSGKIMTDIPSNIR
jgi:hypothetical protein